MKKNAIILATVALLATGGTTALAANAKAGQGIPAYTQQAERGTWMNGGHHGMMGLSQQNREAVQAMTVEERLDYMQDRMRERLQENSDMTKEEREAFIQERIQEREQALEDGNYMGPRDGFGMGYGNQHCLGN